MRGLIELAILGFLAFWVAPRVWGGLSTADQAQIRRSANQVVGSLQQFVTVMQRGRNDTTGVNASEYDRRNASIDHATNCACSRCHVDAAGLVVDKHDNECQRSDVELDGNAMLLTRKSCGNRLWYGTGFAGRIKRRKLPNSTESPGH